MNDSAMLRAQDIWPVHSRVSWGAILAGGVVALALSFLLSLLGSALGLSVTDRVRPDQLGTGAAAWAIAAILISLFVGGWVAARCTVGEDKGEAVLSGVIVWAVVTSMLLWLTAASVRIGFNAMIALASVQHLQQHPAAALPADLDGAAERAGLSREQLDRLRSALPGTTEEIRRAAEDPQTRLVAMQTAWWVFVGTLLSLLATTTGALVGSGPMPALVRGVAMRISRTTLQTPAAANRS